MKRVAPIAFALGLVGCSSGPGTYNDTSGSDEGPVGEVDIGGNEDPDRDDDTGGSTPSTTSGSSSSSSGGDSTGPVGTGGGSTTGEPNDDPQPSIGCAGRTLEPGNYGSQSIDHGSLNRTYDLVVPPMHDGVTPLPVVLSFHPAGQGPGAFSNLTDLEDTADPNWVVVHPRGFGLSWNAGSCCGEASVQGVDDVDFVRALTTTLGATLCIDERRIYATGLGAGAMLSYRLACEASDIIAAVAPVAGAVMIGEASCNPPRAVPVMHFHGTEDPIVGYDGGGFPGNPGTVAQTVQGWVARNGCGMKSVLTFNVDDTMCETWGECSDGAEVTLCTVDGMGHCWPGAGNCTAGERSETLSANDAMLQFFAGFTTPPA